MSFLAETFFMESTSDNVKELNIIMEQANIDFMKIDQMFTMLECQRNINLASAELKVVVESGTTSDLEMLYEAANAEAEGKKAGIVSSAIKAIRNFFGRIIDFINEKILKRTDTSGTVRVDKGLLEKYDSVTKADGEVKGIVAKVKSGQIPSVEDIAKVLAAITAAAAVTTGVVVTVKKTDLFAKSKNLLKKSEEIDSTVGSLENNGNANKVTGKFWNIFRKFGDFINGIIKDIEIALAAKKTAKEINKNINGKTEITDDQYAAAVNGQVYGDEEKKASDSVDGQLHDEYQDKSFEPRNGVNTESAYDNIEDIFGADYMYESAMSELEQMIDEL